MPARSVQHKNLMAKTVQNGEYRLEAYVANYKWHAAMSSRFAFVLLTSQLFATRRPLKLWCNHIDVCRARWTSFDLWVLPVSWKP